MNKAKWLHNKDVEDAFVKRRHYLVSLFTWSELAGLNNVHIWHFASDAV